jgi:hypothetical protein
VYSACQPGIQKIALYEWRPDDSYEGILEACLCKFRPAASIFISAMLTDFIYARR